MSSYQKRSKDEVARRVAQDIPDGAYVNLGIGQPTLVANHVPAGREVILQSENGILGMGPAPAEGAEDFDLINAGKQPVTLLPGGAYFHHADSFAMMRGGHLDVCVLGAFPGVGHGRSGQLEHGRARRHPRRGRRDGPGRGGQADLGDDGFAHPQGQSKLVAQCTYPLTGIGCVRRVYTDLATLACTPEGLQLIDVVDGLTLAELQQLVGLPIRPPPAPAQLTGSA